MLGKRLHLDLVKANYTVLTCGKKDDSDIYLDLESEILPNLPSNLIIDCIFHCASSFENDSIEGFKKNEKINSYSSILISEIAKQLNCKVLIYAGSIFSSDRNEDLKMLNSYALSKYRSEQIFQNILYKNKIKFMSLRLSQLIDDTGECVKHQPWFGRIIYSAISGVSISIPQCNFKQNFIHIEDASQALIAGMESKKEGIHPFTHYEDISYYDLALLSYKLLKSKGSINIDYDKAPFREYYFPSSKKTYEIIDFIPKIKIEKIIERIKNEKSALMFNPEIK